MRSVRLAAAPVPLGAPSAPRPTSMPSRRSWPGSVGRQADRCSEAADLVVASLRAGGVVQAFGTGHSEALAMELAGRAGGLVPTNRISLRDVVIFGGEPPEVLGNGLLERDPSIAHRLYDLAAVSADDVVRDRLELRRQRRRRRVRAAGQGARAPADRDHLLHPDGGRGLPAPVRRQADRPRRRRPRQRRAVRRRAAPPARRRHRLRGVLDHGGAARPAGRAPRSSGGCSRPARRPPSTCRPTSPVAYEHNSVLEARYAGRIRRTA